MKEVERRSPSARPGARRTKQTRTRRVAAVLLAGFWCAGGGGASSGQDGTASVAAQAKAGAEPAAAKQEPPAPPPACASEHYFCDFDLRYGSERVEKLLEAAKRQILLKLGYSLGEGCGKLAEADVDGVEEFHRTASDRTRRCLEIGRSRHPNGDWVLQVFGSRGDTGEPNPDVARVYGIFETLVREIDQAPLDPLTDRVLPYQLSYIQADRALSILEQLGYSVVRFGLKNNATLTGAVQDQLFEAVAAEAGLRRPVVIQLIDSGRTSLVTSERGTKGDTTLTGGSELDGITSGVPEQRLFIVTREDEDKELERLLNLLTERIDVPARQVLIEALIIELDDERLRDLGVSFQGKDDGWSFSFNDPTAGLPFIGTFTRPSVDTPYELTASIQALLDEGEAQVLSRPSVLVLDGRQARIKVAEEIPYLKALQSVDGGDGMITEISFLTAGIILNLRPRASSDGSEVTVQVEAIISSAGPSAVTSDGIPVAPSVQSREVQTFVRVANDTPFVIGGLIATTESTNVTGIPGLARIPGIGRLFRKENRVADRKEVAVIITPHVVEVEDRDFSYVVPKDYPQDVPASQRRFSKGAPGTGDLFDSFDSRLFRNVYRLRSSDVFDFGFLHDSEDYRRLRQRVERTAKSISRLGSTEVPAIDRDTLVAEVRHRLEAQCSSYKENLGRPIDATPAPLTYVPEHQKSPVENLLQVLEGGVPGEEILVQRMLYGILKEDRFRRFAEEIDSDNVIYFEKDDLGGINVKFFTELKREYDARTRDDPGVTLVISFDPGADPGSVFSPPLASISWVGREAGGYQDYQEALRDGNPRETAGDGGWLRQEIRLSAGFGFDPWRHLQLTLMLKRLLELNQGRGLLTLPGFHPGREVVFPTVQDLRERNHLVDRKTAQLFYETLDYYWAFEQEYRRLRAELLRCAPAASDGSRE